MPPYDPINALDNQPKAEKNLTPPQAVGYQEQQESRPALRAVGTSTQCSANISLVGSKH